MSYSNKYPPKFSEMTLPKIEDWFDGKNYKEGRELNTRIYAKGGEVNRDEPIVEFEVKSGEREYIILYRPSSDGVKDISKMSDEDLINEYWGGDAEKTEYGYDVGDAYVEVYKRMTMGEYIDRGYAKGGLTQVDKPPYYMVSLINWNKNINRVSGRFRTEEEAKQKAEKLKEKYKERHDFNVEITFYDDNYNKKKVEYAKGGDVSYATIIYNDIPVKHRIVGIPYVYDDDGEILWDDGPVKGEGVILDELVMTDRERAEYSDKKVYMKGMDRDEFWKKYQRVELQKAGDRGVGFAKGGLVKEEEFRKKLQKGDKINYIISADLMNFSSVKPKKSNIINCRLISEEYIGSIVTLFLESIDGTEFKIQIPERELSKFNIQNGRCEDSLNIVDSIGEIKEIRVSSAFSDALDIDFSDGKRIVASMTQNSAMRGSEYLADRIQVNLDKRIDSINRGVKQAGFHVLVGATMPNVLVEVGFITNKYEAKQLAKAQYKREIAKLRRNKQKTSYWKICCWIRQFRFRIIRKRELNLASLSE